MALSQSGREQPPSLQPPTSSVSLTSFNDRSTGSRSSSPARGRNRSQLSRNHRSSSNASGQRDYILDLADPEGTPAKGAESRRQQKHPATFQCTLCPKRFTRAYNLRSQLRTHTDEKLFVCTMCGKAFARQHDRKRHEGLHSVEKKLACHGTLLSGSSWGCGRRFARVDALGRHFRSGACRVCFRPILDEEAAERQKAWLEEQRQAQIAAGLVAPQPMMAKPHVDMMDNFLPAMLLQQYPALVSLDWDSIPQGPPTDETFTGHNSTDASDSGKQDTEAGQRDTCPTLSPNTYDAKTKSAQNQEHQENQQPQHVARIAQELASRWLKGYAKPDLGQYVESGIGNGQVQHFDMDQQQPAKVEDWMNGLAER